MPTDTTSPIQTLSQPKDTSQEVNEATDTVYGQLQKHTSQDNPLLKRVAMKANEQSASRGLTNSSIAIGNAQGAVIDQAGKFATTDAEIYSNRKNQNQQADVHLEATKMGNETTLTQQQMSSDAQLANTNLQLSSQEQIASQRVAHEALSLDKEILSKENLANLELNTTVEQAALERENRQFLQHMDDQTRLQIEAMNQQAQDYRQRYGAVNDAWSNLQQGIAAINPQATTTSQATMFARLQESFESRMTFINAIGGYTPDFSGSTNSTSGAYGGIVANYELGDDPVTQADYDAEIADAAAKKAAREAFDAKAADLAAKGHIIYGYNA